MAAAGREDPSGGVIRHFFNTRNTGARGAATAWQFPVAALIIIALIGFTAAGFGPSGSGDAEAETPSAEEAFAVVQARCVSCHAAKPTDNNFEEPPGGVMFDQPAQLRTHAARVLAQTVLSDATPLGNETGMTEEERQLLGAWIRAGAPEYDGGSNWRSRHLISRRILLGAQSRGSTPPQTWALASCAMSRCWFPEPFGLSLTLCQL